MWSSSGTSAHMQKVETEELVGQAEREQSKPGKMSVMEEKNMTKLSRAEGTEKTRTESIP